MQGVDLVRDFNRAIDKLMEPRVTQGDRKIAKDLARTGVSVELMDTHMKIREDPPFATMTAREALLHGFLENYGPHRGSNRLAAPFYRAAADKGCTEGAYQHFQLEYYRRTAQLGEPYTLTPEESVWVIEEGTKVALLGAPDAYSIMAQAHRIADPAVQLKCLHMGIKAGSSMCAMNMSMDKPHRENIYFLKMAAGLGHSGAREVLMHKNPADLEPLGYWEPTHECNQWVYSRLRAEIKAILLMSVRETTLFSLLPRDVLYALCFWVSTGPRPGSENKKRSRTVTLQQRIFEQKQQREKEGRVDGRPHRPPMGWLINQNF